MTSNLNRDDEYYRYLCGQLNGSKYKKYSELISLLYNITFMDISGLDRNRVADAKNMYKAYFESEDAVPDEDRCQPSVFEVLLALSIRCEQDIMGVPGSDENDKWFWIMLDNLGLLDFENKKINRISVLEIRRIVDIFLRREYEFDGLGGILPLKNAENDQRKVELWYQLSSYLNENY